MNGVRLYRPRPEQLPFHLSKAPRRLVRGGNRSGKTIAAACEFASALTRIPIAQDDDKLVPFQFPKDRPIIAWMIGFDERHIARMYRKLFRPGLFKIIIDRGTREWRAWKPWLPEDAAREKETKPSPPLIDPLPINKGGRFVEEWAWTKKGQRIFSVCRFKGGSEIYAFTSGGKAAQGDAVDVLWIDEDIEFEDSVQEWEARLADNHGKLIWSAWPHSRNGAIKLMAKRAQEQAGKQKPDVEEWVLKFSNNPYIDGDQKRILLEGWAAKSDAEVQTRDNGSFMDGLQLVFPTYDQDYHGLPRATMHRDALDRWMEAHEYVIPDDWSRYVVVDPGTQHPAAIVAVIPPPEIGDYVIIEKEV